MNEVNILFMYKHPTKGMFHIEINEPCISMSVFNYLLLLSESGYIYTQDETQKILLAKIEKYENELLYKKGEA